MFDEATDIKQSIESASKALEIVGKNTKHPLIERVHDISGSEIGVGTKTIDYIKFFFIHGPRIGKWSSKDPAYKLLEQVNMGSPDSHIAICGDLHIPSIGVANGKAAIVAPAAQQITKYAEQKGYTAPVRGFITLESKFKIVYKKSKRNDKRTEKQAKVITDYEFELYLDDYFRKNYPEHFFKVTKYLKEPIQ